MKLVTILSGGMDSATLLWWAKAQGDEVKALTFDYGQRHSKEIDYARELAKLADVEHHVVDLSSIRPLLAGSSQTDSRVAVPEGHYESETMKLTVVPNRNMVMLSIAAAWAISLKYDAVGYAAHGGDHAIYPDCREPFVEALSDALNLADWHSVGVVAPFLDKSKAGIVLEGTRLGVPFGRTWSCYKGGVVHCGKCGTCVERREAFKLSGIPDPTMYE